jgi:hypothetical protein
MFTQLYAAMQEESGEEPGRPFAIHLPPHTSGFHDSGNFSPCIFVVSGAETGKHAVDRSEGVGVGRGPLLASWVQRSRDPMVVGLQVVDAAI